MKITSIYTPLTYGKNSLDNKSKSDNIKNSLEIPRTSVYDTPGLYTSWFYINDIHGKMTNIERLLGIVKEFDITQPENITSFYKDVPQDKIIKMKVSSGDILLGANNTHNRVANMLLDRGNFLASALGNHEVDGYDPFNLSRLLNDSNYVMLAANVDAADDSPLRDKIKKSIVVERNGEKFGIIGIAPSDMYQRVKMNDTLRGLNVHNLEETIKIVENEVNEFKKQGINKIVVLSHSGSKNDVKIAKNVDGIDIIFSAHTHELYEGVKEGVNLFYSKSGEPVVLTQAGKDGETAGILNAEFDKNGVITRVQNNILNVRKYNRPYTVKYLVESVLGKSEVIGRVKRTVPPPDKRLIENNPHGNLIVDAMRQELGTDIGLLNAGNIRGSFSEGPIDTRLISDITPFEDKMMVINLSEEQIVDAIKFGCKSVTKSSNKPGIILVSGLKYTFNKKGELLTLDYIDKENNIHNINIDNPRKDKFYTVAADDFFATGGDGYLKTSVSSDCILKKYDIDKNKLARDYIKKLDQPIEIKKDDRVVMVD